MAYRKVSALPDSVRNSLPGRAQDIYKEAFNAAWDQYKEPQKRRGKESRETAAHKVAWSAVKKKFEKRGDKWVSKT